MTIEFKNPPVSEISKRGLGAETQSVIDALKARPGEWALIKKDVNPSVSTWCKKHAGIEAKASTIGHPKGKCDVYARWVGATS
jgi:hypothetical protein